LNRFCNIIDQTILSIMEMDKIVIHICSGDVLSLFMNVSLACDYRIVGSDTVFHNVYQEIGMLPKGAAPYFLRHAIGAGRTKELLLMHQRITARQAFENGIAERIVPPEELESVAADVAAKFSLLPEQTLAGTKRLTNFPLQQFKEYLEFETDQILRIGHRMEFDDQ
jgi:enoyl-CoA hydratase/carnithine racemase